MGSNELPSSNVLHEGPAIALGKKGGFAGTHILVPRGGLAVHINAFNFPIWGLLEKFAPSFLAAMPCIAKPATATSYLTEAVVRMMHESGLLPEGSLQLVIGSTGDLLDRLNGQDVVTFTGSAATAAKLRTNPNLIAQSVPFNGEADSLNCAILAPDVTPDDPEFDLFIKEIVREMTGKSGQKCTAIRRMIVPDIARRGRHALARTAGQGGGRRPVDRRRAHGGAGLDRTAARRGRARRDAVAGQRDGVRRGRRLHSLGDAQDGSSSADPAAVPRRLGRRRGARRRSVRPRQHRDALRYDEAVDLAGRGKGSLVAPCSRTTRFCRGGRLVAAAMAA